MRNQLIYICLLLIFNFSLLAQDIRKSPQLKVAISTKLQEKIETSLDSLFLQIQKGDLHNEYIYSDQAALTKSIFSYLKGVEKNKETGNTDFYKKELINFYPIAENTFSLNIAYLGYDSISNRAVIKMMVQLLAIEKDNEIQFTLPLKHLTRNWKSETVGDIRYFYQDHIRRDRAELFNVKNTIIAKKMGVIPEQIDFYMCDNYQEILTLLGIKYDLTENGETASGYGVDAGTIFSIQNNEDFSHDIFHYYSGKVNQRSKRNWVAEEGIAYSWGNAYYVDAKGEMIHQDLLVKEIKTYLESHPDSSLLQLFEKDTKIFNHLCPKVSVRSFISSLICDLIEREKGIEGIFSIINCGKKQENYENYYQAINDLVNINPANFNQKVTQLIVEYSDGNK